MPARNTRTDLYEQIALRLRSRFLLLDVDWIFGLVVARSEATPLIDEVIDDVLARERDDHERGARPTDAERDRYRFWTDVLQLDLADARLAAVTFNALDDHTRQAFFALIIEDRSVQECVDAGLGDREALGQIVRTVFRAVLDAHVAR